MKVIDFTEKRKQERFRKHVKGLQDQPTMTLLGETVPNFVIHPSDEEIAVKYQPVEGYVLDVSVKQEDIEELADVIAEWKRSKGAKHGRSHAR